MKKCWVSARHSILATHNKRKSSGRLWKVMLRSMSIKSVLLFWIQWIILKAIGMSSIAWRETPWQHCASYGVIQIKRLPKLGVRNRMSLWQVNRKKRKKAVSNRFWSTTYSRWVYLMTMQAVWNIQTLLKDGISHSSRSEETNSKLTTCL